MVQGNQAQPVSRSVQIVGDDSVSCQTTQVAILSEGITQNEWQAWLWQVRLGRGQEVLDSSVAHLWSLCVCVCVSASDDDIRRWVVPANQHRAFWQHQLCLPRPRLQPGERHCHDPL